MAKFLKGKRLKKVRDKLNLKTVPIIKRFPDLKIIEISKRNYWYCNRYKQYLSVCSSKCRFKRSVYPLQFCLFLFRETTEIQSLYTRYNVKSPENLWLAILKEVYDEDSSSNYYRYYAKREWKYDSDIKLKY